MGITAKEAKDSLFPLERPSEAQGTRVLELYDARRVPKLKDLRLARSSRRADLDQQGLGHGVCDVAVARTTA